MTRRVADWHPQPGMVRIAPIPTGTQWDQARAAIAAHHPTIAILDPLVEAVTAWGLESNADTTPATVINRIHDLCGQIPTVILAHNRKQTDGPAIDQIRGTGAIAGKGGIVHTVKGAEGIAEVRNLAYRDGPTTAPWTLDLATGQWSAAKPTVTDADRVLDGLRDIGGPATVRDIETASKVKAPGDILTTLLDGGTVHQHGGYNGHKRWCAANRLDCHGPAI